MRLDRFARIALLSDEAAGGAVSGFVHDELARGGLIRFAHQVPHLTVRIAEARERAQTLRVLQHDAGPLEALGLRLVRFAARRLGPVEVDLVMRPITERGVARLPAAAE